jgi:hypothetical protein
VDLVAADLVVAEYLLTMYQVKETQAALGLKQQ